MEDIILEVKNLKQHFKSGTGKNKLVNKAVDDISFSIRKGEVFSLVGESGCGKTTTGRTIIKLYKATGGEVTFLGKKIISDLKVEKERYQAGLVELNKWLDLETAKIGGDDTPSAIDKRNEIKAKYEKSKEELKLPLIKARTESKGHYQKDATFEESKKDKNLVPGYTELEKKSKKDLSALESTYKADDLKKEELTKEVYQSKVSNSAIEVTKDLEEKLKQQTAKAKKSKLDYDIAARKWKISLDKICRDYYNQDKYLMRKMQMIFQDPIASLNPRMTVKEIIAEGLRINGVKNEEEIDFRVKEALKTVGLVAEHASRYPHEFSGGQRQRIGIARALVVEPSFIIADEPISALDVSIRAQVINLLNDIREQRGITILFIAHDLSVVKYFSDRLAVMYYGKIVEIGSKKAVFEHPLHPYTLSLIASIPLPDPNYEKKRGLVKRYDSSLEHNYSKEDPILREIEPDHFVLCDSVEYTKYLEQVKHRK